MPLQAFYGLRSERQLMERMEFDLLFRWFVGLGVDDAAWDHSSFSKNRDRLLAGKIAAKTSWCPQSVTSGEPEWFKPRKCSIFCRHTGGASPRGFCGQKATRTTSLATWSLKEAEAAAEFAAAASRDWIGYKGHSVMARDAGSANVIRRAAPKSKFSTGR
jgi:hypothetical protein